jgi:hypothetical protein
MFHLFPTKTKIRVLDLFYIPVLLNPNEKYAHQY